MSGILVFRRILLPQMMRHALPGFGNNWLVLLKATALMSVIGMDDMLRKASLAAGAPTSPSPSISPSASSISPDERLDADPGLGRAPLQRRLQAPRMMDFGIIWDSLPLYLEGLVTTVWLVAVSLIAGLLIAVPLGIHARLAQSLREFPGLGLHLLLSRYAAPGTALPHLLRLRAVRGDPRELPLAAPDSTRGSARSWPSCSTPPPTRPRSSAAPSSPRRTGEIEAARACGMSPALCYRRIILPFGLPPGPARLRQRGDPDAARQRRRQHRDDRRHHGCGRSRQCPLLRAYEAFLTAAAFYMALTFIIVGGFRLLERHWFAHLRARPH